MSNTHRLIWFDKQIRALLYPNRRAMAEKFEISTRQAQRDIDYLKNSLQAPIKYDAKKRGYFYEDENYILPNVYINDIQKKMLKFLAYRYENYTQTPKVIQMSELFKLLADEKEIDDEIPTFDLEKPVVRYYYIIYNAILAKHKLKVLYKDCYRGNINITLDPYRLFYKYDTDYLVGYDSCESCGSKLSILRLDRIIGLEVLNESFAVIKEFDEEDYSSLISKEPFTAKIKFSKYPDFKGNKEIRIKALEDSVYEIKFFEIDEFINQLICSGCWDKILKPKWLRNKIAKRCDAIMLKLDR